VSPEHTPPEGGDETDLGRILTIPNLLSLVRLSCIPLFLWLLFGRDNHVAAAWLLAGLSATDWVDGYVARRYHQVSTLGKILDPTADRLLLGVGAVSCVAYGAVPLWIGVPAIAREVLVGAMALTLAALGARRIDVSRAGKCGTFAMMTAFPLFLVGDGEGWMVYAAYPIAIGGLVVGWYSAFMYVPQGLRALREGRAASGRGGRGGRGDTRGGTMEVTR
jgi:cardiolipin synthase (CMP-forming)